MNREEEDKPRSFRDIAESHGKAIGDRDNDGLAKLVVGAVLNYVERFECGLDAELELHIVQGYGLALYRKKGRVKLSEDPTEATVRPLVCPVCAQKRRHVLAHQRKVAARGRGKPQWWRVWRCLTCRHEHGSYGQEALVAEKEGED